jgi:hypothetical protein
MITPKAWKRIGRIAANNEKEIFMGNIFVLIGGIVLFLFGRYLDFNSSKDFIYYGIFERNPLWRDQWGFFKPGIHWILVFATVAAAVVIRLLFPFDEHPSINYFMLGVLLIGGAASIWASMVNEKQKKINRVKQAQVLNQVRALAEDVNIDPNSEQMQNLFNQAGPYTIKAGRAFHRLFGWLYVTVPENTATNDAMAAASARRKVVEYAQQVSPSAWFPR